MTRPERRGAAEASGAAPVPSDACPPLESGWHSLARGARVLGRWRRASYRIWLVPLLLLSAATSAQLYWSYHSDSAGVEDEGLSSARNLTTEAAKEVDKLSRPASEAARYVADLLSGSRPARPDTLLPGACPPSLVPSSQHEAVSCLRSILESNQDFFGGSITYAPSLGPKPVYFHRSGRTDAAARQVGPLSPGEISPEYATSTAPGYRWYRDPMTSGNDGWSPPYYDDAGSEVMTTYSAVFGAADPRSGGRMGAGVVTIDISGDRIGSLMRDLALGPSGYAALTTANGAYLYHPNPEYLQGFKTILQVARDKNDGDRTKMWESIQRKESDALPHTSTTTGEESWLVWEYLEDSGWSLQNTFIKSDIANVNALRHKLIGAVAAAGLFLLALLAYVLKLDVDTERRWWLLSTGASVLFALEIGAIWALALSHPLQGSTGRLSDSKPRQPAQASRTAQDGAAQAGPTTALPDQGADGGLILTREHQPRRIADRASLERLQGAYRQEAAKRKSHEPVFVEAGISVENLMFLGANEVRLGGYLWERIPKTGAAIAGSFTIANAIDVKKEALGEHTDPNGTRVLRWKFDATVAQNRDSTRYPIEQEVIRIHLRHDSPVTAPAVTASPAAAAANDAQARRATADASETADRGYRVHLVPALSDYEVMAPSSRPGLDEALVVPGWRPTSSYFELTAPPSGSNLGVATSANDLTPPGLAFAIVVERDFADAFISNLTPIIVVAILLFAVLMVSAKLDYGRALSICTGMFFVIVFSHIDLRQRLAAQEIFYLEYFYFAIYAGVLWVSFTCLLQGFKKRIAFLELRERLMLKTLYWPALLGVLYARTLMTFY